MRKNIAILIFILVNTSCVKEPSDYAKSKVLRIDQISENEATCYIEIIEDGGSKVFQSGVVWSQKTKPTLSNSLTTEGEGERFFSSKMSDLQAGSKYFVRSYTTNEKGTSYGNELTFRTGLANGIFKESAISDIDGNQYGTTAIGTQVWMTENLKTTKLNDGEELIEFSGKFSQLQGKCYTWYDNNSNNKEAFEAYYSPQVIETNKVCPVGWKVPSVADVNELMHNAIGFGISNLRTEEEENRWNKSGFVSNNSYHFSAKGSGFAIWVKSLGKVIFRDHRNTAYFWHSDSNKTYFTITPSSLIMGINVDNELQKNGLAIPIRCIKDN